MAKRNPNAKHTLDDVLKALQDLVRNELADSDANASQTDSAGSDNTDAAPPPHRTSDSSDSDAASDLALADSVVQLLTETGEALAADTAPAIDPNTGTTASEPAASTPDSPTPAAPTPRRPSAIPEQTQIDWDQIPVLNDIVAIPAATRLVAPTRARELAVRVIAKLNIELRKAGTTPLDPVIIDRLEHLLREALELAAANPDGQAQN